MKFYFKDPDTMRFLGPATVDEASEWIAAGCMNGQWGYVEATGQTFRALSLTKGWAPVNSSAHWAEVASRPPRDLAGDGHGAERHAPALRNRLVAAFVAVGVLALAGFWAVGNFTAAQERNRGNSGMGGGQSKSSLRSPEAQFLDFQQSRLGPGIEITGVVLNVESTDGDLVTYKGYYTQKYNGVIGHGEDRTFFRATFENGRLKGWLPER